ncbi:ABC transporter ATP-binding protein [Ornithinicoccus halotolerans]|uniref:ABC transporter ATP-binding protein n=1 Tax=Ornithinicoccus halotolerans TaxID=1748220 RepID=UPI001297DA9D|nr:ABC transporter ATP-binding protein [Ornithinicoccus halotolerans]
MGVPEHSPDAHAQDPTGQQREPGEPTVVVSHLDIIYRVFGAGRARSNKGQDDGDNAEPAALLNRLTQRSRNVGGVRRVHAVKDVSFVARRGESIGIVGRNGSGKSTLLRAVAGLIPPDGGEVWLGGRAALLGVNAALVSQVSGARNVMIGGQALGLTKAQVRERFDEIVDFADIGHFIDLPMSSYSSGMGARLRFAISTAAVPDILVVDEALSAGDAQFRAKAAERVKQLRDQAGTVFMVSHNNNTIRQTCTRVLWLEQGQLVMDGEPNEVLPAYSRAVSGRSQGRARASGGRGRGRGRPRVHASSAAKKRNRRVRPQDRRDGRQPGREADGESQDEQ